MREFWRRIEHGTIKPWLRRVKPSRTKTLGGVRVHYMKHLDGGGAWFGQDYIPLLKSWGVSKQDRIFEWCAGPGFIGFSLLGHGLCQTLCLADINPDAVAACQRTVARNDLGKRVSVYRSDNLKDIPQTELWNLIVANPPHFAAAYAGELRCHDPDWRIHQEFFSTITPFLSASGVIVLQENTAGSTAETFREMIASAGLKIVFAQGNPPERTADHRFYYV